VAEGVNVRLSGPLLKFVDYRAGPDGLYSTASEYIRDLVRRDFKDFKVEENRRWTWLREQLRPGMEADGSEFEEFDAEKIIAEAHDELSADGL